MLCGLEEEKRTKCGNKGKKKDKKRKNASSPKVDQYAYDKDKISYWLKPCKFFYNVKNIIIHKSKRQKHHNSIIINKFFAVLKPFLNIFIFYAKILCGFWALQPTSRTLFSPNLVRTNILLISNCYPNFM